jgi:hypothetical protein
LQARYPDVEIIVRADGGFGVPAMLNCCHRLGIKYCFGKPQNKRLHALSERYQLWAAIRYSWTKRPHKEYGEFQYAAGSWKREERTIVKAEVTQGKLNPRFVVTNLGAGEEATEDEKTEWTAEGVYTFYCGRGEGENRIKEFKIDMGADRLSCCEFRANQFRLLLHVGAYLLVQEMQEALSGTEMAQAQAGTIRVRLMKVAARVIERCRVVRVQMPSSYPWQEMWRRMVERLKEGKGEAPGYAMGSG